MNTVPTDPEEHPSSTTIRPRLCAHADQDGGGAHWLAPGERCPLAAKPTRPATEVNTEGSPATDVEHDDDGCTTCNPRWAPTLLPCPAWCVTDHAAPGEDEDLTESWNQRLHVSRDLLMIRRQVPADAPHAVQALPDRVAVSVCVAVTDNVTDGTRGDAGIMVETGDALTPAEGRRLLAAVGEGLRILDPPTGYAEGFLDGYTAGRKRQD